METTVDLPRELAELRALLEEAEDHLALLANVALKSSAPLGERELTRLHELAGR